MPLPAGSPSARPCATAIARPRLWSGPPAYGTFALRAGVITIEVLGGAMPICRLGLPTGGEAPTAVRVDGRSIPFESGEGDIVFEPVELAAGVRIEVEGPGITLDGLVEVATFDDGEAR